MAASTQTLTDGFISVNGVDLSEQMQAGTLTYNPDSLDATAMSAGTTHTKKAGLLNWGMDVTFFQSYAAGSVNATIFPLVGAAAFSVEMRPVKTGGRTTTNPGFLGNAIVTNYSPLGGKVGDQIVTSPKFEQAGPLTMPTT